MKRLAMETSKHFAAVYEISSTGKPRGKTTTVLVFNGSSPLNLFPVAQISLRQAASILRRIHLSDLSQNFLSWEQAQFKMHFEGQLERGSKK